MKTLLWLACATMLVAGCARDRNLNPITNVQEAAKDKDLQGKTFLSACSASPGEALQSMLKVTAERTAYRFEGNNATRETRYYAKSDCSGDPAFTIRELGDIKIDKNQKTNDGGYNIDISWKSAKVNILNEEGAKAANTATAPLCGLKDWKPKQDRDVTPQAKDVSCANARLPRKDFNIYRVDAGTLYLGRTERSENTPQERPRKLEATKYSS